MPQDRLEKPTEETAGTHNEASEPSVEDASKSNAATTPSISATSGTSEAVNDAIISKLSQLSTTPEKPSRVTPKGSLRVSKAAARPQLQGHTTTAVTRADIHGTAHSDGSPSTSAAASRAQSRRGSFSKPQAPTRKLSRLYNEVDDCGSVKSVLSNDATLLNTRGAEGLLDEVLSKYKASAWVELQGRATEQEREEESPPTEAERQRDQEFESQFASEFVELDDLKTQGNTEESLMLAWSLKLKHFFILSSAGKPIWSRHGDDELISNSIGVIQTIISFYQDAKDTLKSFATSSGRFCILSKGHLFLVAVSRMGENDTQLRAQLEALYMQILSTLTLTNMEKMFANRPSTDLRRPLQGTEKLLSSLADGFTRGSPSTLLSALECLRLRKVHRAAINKHFAKARVPSLLYGLLVTDTGQLVSVLRPKKHSLHPGDLQLIFNMLFEGKAIRAAGGENWIPLCLPGFNNTGFVYMYVSFVDVGKDADADVVSSSPSHRSTDKETTTSSALTPAESHNRSAPPQPQPQEYCLVLISAHPNSFDELRSMRNTFVSSLIGSTTTSNTSSTPSKNSSATTPLLQPLRTALSEPRPSLFTIAPGSPIHHFLYKSRTNVQFVQPSASPHFSEPLSWRRLMSRYSSLHASVHSRGVGRNKVVFENTREGVNVAWCTPMFEMYVVAPRESSRAAVERGLEMCINWVKREEERCFVVGGAVF
ncbi:MAG: hypothetical protein Q9162_001866 [Coniocarpon cinnabarinum]